MKADIEICGYVCAPDLEESRAYSLKLLRPRGLDVSRAKAGILGSVLQFVLVEVGGSKDWIEVPGPEYGLLLFESVRESGGYPGARRAAEVGESGRAATLGGLLYGRGTLRSLESS